MERCHTEFSVEIAGTIIDGLLYEAENVSYGSLAVFYRDRCLAVIERNLFLNCEWNGILTIC